MAIPIEDFGRDHWSTFAYIETCVVDCGGRVAKERMRCIHKRHLFFAHRGGDASAYPTRLRGGRKRNEHDDWDCLDDIEVAGLIENIGTGLNPIFLLTDFGREVAGKLRGHKGQGGTFDEFFVGELRSA